MIYYYLELLASPSFYANLIRTDICPKKIQKNNISKVRNSHQNFLTIA